MIYFLESLVSSVANGGAFEPRDKTSFQSPVVNPGLSNPI